MNDPWGVSGTDPYASEDCGEECLAEVTFYYQRVELTAWQIRTELPGHAYSGLTTGADLAGWLRGRGIAGTAMETVTADLRTLIRREVLAGRPVIVLGFYAGQVELHWVVARAVGDGRVGFNDPWGGLYRITTWAWFLAHYAGQVVTTASHRPWWKR